MGCRPVAKPRAYTPLFTLVVVQLEALAAQETGVRWVHLGWRPGDEWGQVYDYFVRAWDVVLQRLVHRFALGPVPLAWPGGEVYVGGDGVAVPSHIHLAFLCLPKIEED
jgi:hypothetical protein